MEKNFSFSHLENELIPEFRDRVNTSEDILDLKNLFAYTMALLLKGVFLEKINFNQQDVVFDPQAENYLKITPTLARNSDFLEMAGTSDLLKVMGRFSHTIHNRYLHLLRHPPKRAIKIRK